jgi:glutamine synthetase
VNSYRRLDPHFEAPNEIKKSACDRGSMVRIPLANEKSARIEVRSVAPDASPYLAYFSILTAGLDAITADKTTKEKMEKAVYKKEPDTLFENLTDAVSAFEKSEFLKKAFGVENHQKYAELKRAVAERSPKLLGSFVKKSEVLYHHDVYNQILWNNF